MGAACSRKQHQHFDVDKQHRGFPGRYCKSGSSKWLATSFSRSLSDLKHGIGKSPSLMELCTRKICEDINRYGPFSTISTDISQQIFDELVYSQRLDDVILEAFRDCALQVLNLAEHPGFNDSWMDVIASQGLSLLTVDLSGSDVTDAGLSYFKDCKNLQALNFNYCDHISDWGLEHLTGRFSFIALATFHHSIHV